MYIFCMSKIFHKRFKLSNYLNKKLGRASENDSWHKDPCAPAMVKFCNRRVFSVGKEEMQE